MGRSSFGNRLMGGIGALLLLALTVSGIGTIGVAVAAQQDDELPGVEDNRYESPTYGYTIEWSDDDWVVDDAGSRRGNDYLTLLTEESVGRTPGEGEFASIRLFGTASFDADPAVCLEDAMSEWEDSPIADDFGIDEDHDRPELPEMTGVSEQFTYVLYPEDTAEQWVHYVACVELRGGDAVLQIEYRATEPAFEEWLDAANDVFASLELAQGGQG